MVCLSLSLPSLPYGLIVCGLGVGPVCDRGSFPLLILCSVLCVGWGCVCLEVCVLCKSKVTLRFAMGVFCPVPVWTAGVLVSVSAIPTVGVVIPIPTPNSYSYCYAYAYAYSYSYSYSHPIPIPIPILFLFLVPQKWSLSRNGLHSVKMRLQLPMLAAPAAREILASAPV